MLFRLKMFLLMFIQALINSWNGGTEGESSTGASSEDEPERGKGTAAATNQSECLAANKSQTSAAGQSGGRTEDEICHGSQTDLFQVLARSVPVPVLYLYRKLPGSQCTRREGRKQDRLSYGLCTHANYI
jgi:hypothetical protein